MDPLTATIYIWYVPINSLAESSVVERNGGAFKRCVLLENNEVIGCCSWNALTLISSIMLAFLYETCCKVKLLCA